MHLQIRRLNKADSEPFFALRKRMLDEHPEAFSRFFDDEDVHGPGALAQRLDENNAECGLYGSFVDDKLVGSIGFFRERGQKLAHKAVLWGAFVAPEAQGNGIGRALIDKALEHVRTIDDVKQVYASVGTGLPTALHLYEVAGFKAFGTEPRSLYVNGKYWDETHMTLMLD